MYEATDCWNEFLNIHIHEMDDNLPPSKGDVNGDGVVTPDDIIEIVKYILNGNLSVKIDEKTADANGDGIVNLADIVTIVNNIVDD